MTAREARSARAAGSARRTYLCLEGQTRKPSDYEITTTGQRLVQSRETLPAFTQAAS